MTRKGFFRKGKRILASMLACLMVLTDSSLITLAESTPHAAEEEAAIAGVSGSDLPEAQVDVAETRVGTGDGGDVSGSDAVTIVHSGHVDNGTAQGVDWSIDSNGKLLVEGTGNFMQEEGNLVPVWSEEYREEIVSAVVNVTGADLACAMFEGCTNLQTVDLSGFDTGNVESMVLMFADCSSLKSLDLSSFDTSHVTDMSDMFSGCEMLESINLSGFETSQVGEMRSMFAGCAKLQTIDVSSFNTSAVSSMSEMFLGCKSLKEIDLSNFDVTYCENFYNMFKGCTALETIHTIINLGESVALPVPMMDAEGTTYYEMPLEEEESILLKRLNPDNAEQWLPVEGQIDNETDHITWKITVVDGEILLTVTGTGNCFNEDEQVDWNTYMPLIQAAKLDVKSMTDATRLFRNAVSLKRVDLSNWDTSNVTSVEGMFINCTSLEEIVFADQDTSKVTTTENMFSGCESLQTLDLSWMDTSAVEYMNGMFKGCSSLRSLDVSGFDMRQVYDVGDMFKNCTAIEEINTFKTEVSDSIREHVQWGEYQFSLPVAPMYDADGKEYTEFTEDFPTSTWLYASKEQVPIARGVVNQVEWSISQSGHLVISGEGNIQQTDSIYPPWHGFANSIRSAEINLKDAENLSYMFDACFYLREIDFQELDTSRVTDMSYMFRNCGFTELDLSAFNTSQVTNMEGMFSGCSAKSLDISDFDTSHVTNMRAMFNCCFGLSYLNVSAFDTSQVTDMAKMFAGCNRLTDLDLSNFMTNQVCDMSDLFSECYNLTTLDLSGFNTEKVNNMKGMFYDCSKLNDLNLDKFDTSLVTDMGDMFYGCTSLTDLDLSNFNTGNVEKMYDMFRNCKSLKKLDLSSFNTSKVTGLRGMFGNCNSLTELDVSNFDTKNTNDMSDMFEGCRNLKILDLSSFDLENCYFSHDMFYACASLEQLKTFKNNINSVSLPIVMFDQAGNYYSDIPEGLSETITLSRLTTDSFETLLPLKRHLDNDTDQGIDWAIEKVDEEIVLTVSGTGNPYDEDDDIAWAPYMQYIESANIELTDTTYASGLFRNAEKLRKVNLEKFDTKNVESMSGMFAYCSNLESVDLSGFDTTNVDSMNYMFIGCESLESLDLSSFDMSCVCAAKQMFQNCNNIKTFKTFKTNISEDIYADWKGWVEGGEDDYMAALPTGAMYDATGKEYIALSSDLPMDTWLYASKELIPGFYKTCKIVYDVNGGDKLEFDEIECLENHAYGDLVTPTRTGYTFLGWFTAAEGGEQVTAETICTGDATIYAHWSPIAYKLTYDVNGGDPLETAAAEKTITYGSAYGALVTPTRTGYTFLGWFTAAEGGEQVTAETICTGDATIYAHWSPIACKLTYDVNGGDPLESTETEKTITYGSAYGALVTPTRTGYTFLGWFTAAEDGEQVTAETICTGDVTIYAHWSPIACKLTYDVNGGDPLESTEIEKAITYGNAYGDLVTPTRTGYTFLGWFTAAEAGEQVTAETICTGDATIYAHWSKIENHDGLQLKLADEDAIYTYTGTQIKPAILVTNDGEPLQEGVDYTVKYSNNINAGGATSDQKQPTITVTGKGNLTGSVTISFTIERKDIDDPDVVKGDVVTDNVDKAVPTLSFRGAALKANKDFTSKYHADDPTKGTFVIEGIGNYTGTTSVAVMVKEKKELKKFTVKLAPTDQSALVYDGTPKMPAVIVTDTKSKLDLTADEDYTVIYADNVNAGPAKVMVVGKGDYAGIITKKFTIKPQKANITVQNTNPDAAKGYPYASAGVTIADDLAVYAAKQGASAAENVLLAQGKDYKIAFSANKKAGTAKYTITFLGNYKGTKAIKGSFTIVPAGLSELYRAGEAQIVIGDKAYTGKAGTYVSAPIIRIGDTLLKKSDYTCTYYADEGLQNPVGKGNLISLTDDQPYATVYVKIFGKGNYAENAAAGNTTDGYLVLTYQVRKATYDLSKAKVTVVDANQKKLSRMEYTGQAIEPAVVVTIGSGKNMVTVPADQYVVTYAGNVNKGKATVIVNGISDACVGSKTATFTIVSGKLLSLLHK